MAIVYSMDTVYSLLGKIVKEQNQQDNSNKSTENSIVLPWLNYEEWSCQPAQRKKIWQLALARPYLRKNYSQISYDELNDNLSRNFNLSNITLREMIDLGIHAVEGGLLSVDELINFITISRIEEKFDNISNSSFLTERNMDTPFNLSLFWLKRIKMLNRIKHTNFESSLSIAEFVKNIAFLQLKGSR